MGEKERLVTAPHEVGYASVGHFLEPNALDPEIVIRPGLLAGLAATVGRARMVVRDFVGGHREIARGRAF